MANALAHETSPYLLQHRENPVDWLPWGEAAHARAREQDRPLLVSIGYSACHWCHVMERESFEDEETARLMNERFVCVKVDREERPDVDAIYMEAVQAMTGQGGWPLNVFLTPEQIPFFGGTYFPPEPRAQTPSWRHVLIAVAEAWAERKQEIRAGSGRIVEHLNASARLAPSSEPLREAELEQAITALEAQFDVRHGGFGTAPKFPPSCALELLLHRAATRNPDSREATMALSTLRAMAAGGIHDQVGGGFARYAVDATWTVPHFEKMLYDNALLARAYLHGWQVSADPILLRTCTEALDWALREMRAPEGGFYSALDADSEGREGAYYVWTQDQLRETLGDLAEEAIGYFNTSQAGNFEGANVLEAHGPEPQPERRAQIRERLFRAREARPRPGLDDKQLTAWNALMVSALAETGAALGQDGERYLSAARATAEFLLSRMRDSQGELMRTYKDGRARIGAFLEDYALLVEALLALYEATFEARWFVAGRELADVLIERFADPQQGGFFSTPVGHENLIARRKELQDSPLPSGISSAALGLLRLARLSGEAEYERQAVGALRLVYQLAVRHPLAFGHLLQALALYLGPSRELALVGEDLAPLLEVVRARWRPGLVIAAGRGENTQHPVALLEGRTPVDARPAAYVCERFACQRPVVEPADLAELLD